VNGIARAVEVWPALLLASVALLVWVPPRDAVLRRARDLVTARGAEESGRGHAVLLASTPRSRRWLLAGSAGAAVGVLVGGAWGVGMAGVVAVGGERLLRDRHDGGEGSARADRIRELPAACDLLGVCLAAGTAVAGALEAVGTATPPPLGTELRRVAALYRMGADPRRAWADVPPDLAALARVVIRAGESGSTVVPALRALAADGRTAARAATEAAVRRAGVWVLAPLGLCFLPAFVCLGVVPLILGIAADVFG
jgi:hypothetical protein